MARRRNWKAVGDCVRTRRVELRLRQEDAAEVAGISIATWRLLEGGVREGYRNSTKVAVAQALRWPQDAIDRLLAGASPGALTQEAEATEAKLAGGTPFNPWLARRWSMLSRLEQKRVEAFIDEILASRRQRH